MSAAIHELIRAMEKVHDALYELLALHAAQILTKGEQEVLLHGFGPDRDVKEE